MTVETTNPYYHWNSRSDWNQAPFNDCSPNLVQINHYLSQTFGGHSLGCHNDRVIAGSSSMSSHAWGAALDFLPDGGSAEALSSVAPFLIQWSHELSINAIHDYVHQLIWKPGPQTGWVHASIGSQGGQWLHIETSPSGWADARPVSDRVKPMPPAPPAPGYNPPSDFGLYPLNKNKPALGPGFGYTNGTQQYQGYCQYANDVMKYKAGQAAGGAPLSNPGANPIVWTIYSMAACMNVQQFFHLPVNGWMTLETWAVIDYLAGLK